MDKRLSAAIIYVSLCVVILLGMHFSGWIDLFSESSFLNWDAEHYHWIRNKGYEGFRVAFFPLFPFIWKLIPVGAIGVSVLNGCVFLVSFYFLIRQLGSSWKEVIVYLSIPGCIFFFLPYSEALFFFCSTFILIGLRKNKMKWVYIGLLFATISRPAFTIFIPALLLVEMLSGDRKGSLQRIGMYLLSTALGIILVGLFQFMDTGEWFTFFSVQSGWGNALRLPEFPLTSWAGGFIVRLDGAAFLIGGIAGLVLLANLLKVGKVGKVKLPRELVFSLAYLGGITLSVLLFRGGSLFSLNRFIFATPFILIALHFWLNSTVEIRMKQLWMAFVVIFLFWFFFASYVHIQVLAKFLFLSFYLWLILLVKSDKKWLREPAFFVLILLNIVFQVILFYRFMNNEWVG